MMLGETLVLACAVCFGPNAEAVNQGVNTGLILLLAAPYVLFGTVGGLLYREYRKGAGAGPVAGGESGDTG